MRLLTLLSWKVAGAAVLLSLSSGLLTRHADCGWLLPSLGPCGRVGGAPIAFVEYSGPPLDPLMVLFLPSEYRAARLEEWGVEWYWVFFAANTAVWLLVVSAGTRVFSRGRTTNEPAQVSR